MLSRAILCSEARQARVIVEAEARQPAGHKQETGGLVTDMIKFKPLSPHFTAVREVITQGDANARRCCPRFAARIVHLRCVMCVLSINVKVVFVKSSCSHGGGGLPISGSFRSSLSCIFTFHFQQ